MYFTSGSDRAFENLKNTGMRGKSETRLLLTGARHFSK